MYNADRILDYLRLHPNSWFDDDELSVRLSIQPRQQVNQLCRRLAAEGTIQRERQDGKLRNAIASPARQVAQQQRVGAGSAHSTPSESVPAMPVQAVQLLESCGQAFEAAPRFVRVARRIREEANMPSPRSIVSACRTALMEFLVAEGASRTGSLFGAVNEYASRTGGDGNPVISYMHTIRAIGNQGVHDVEEVSWDAAMMALHALHGIATHKSRS